MRRHEWIVQYQVHQWTTCYYRNIALCMTDYNTSSIYEFI